MEEVERIFNDLESNQTHEWEEAKRKLIECFSQNREQWLVHNLLDYFLRTGSRRIVEVLVKVQAPHDVYILDKLAEWLKTTTHRVYALNLFGFVVRMRPTWLFKVGKHRLIKDIFKLLLTEKDIVPLMSALLCVITLLPIIPNLVPNILNDLFDVFGHLASWNGHNPSRLQDDKLVHLQLGLQMLFHQLYGMYPCNFRTYLADFVKKDKGAIFHHTIKPLLETVRLHPLLVTATTDTEVSSDRWKEMEPHDVVVECARLSLPVLHHDIHLEHRSTLSASDLLDTPGSGGVRSTPGGVNTFRSWRGERTHDKHLSYHIREQLCGPIPRFDLGKGGNGLHAPPILSPYNEIMTAGPIPLTPTPSYMLPLSTPVAANVNNQMLGVTGSSPPEAAVEATPETTPMKDSIKETKHNSMSGGGGGGAGGSATIANPHAVRAISLSSQPSSPMRKETSQFTFFDMSTLSPTSPAATDGAAGGELDLNAHLAARATTFDRRLQQVQYDRTRSQSPFRTIEAQTAKQGYRSPIDSSSKSETPEIDLDSVNFMTNSTATPTPTPVEHITKGCDDCNETERTMCPAGGLHILTSQSVQLLAKQRRARMASLCHNDHNSVGHGGGIGSGHFDGKRGELSGGDGGANSWGAYRVRRTKSWPPPGGVERDDDPNGNHNECDGMVRGLTPQPLAHDRRLQKSGKMLSIAAVTNRGVEGSSMCHAGTQTIETVPQHYENCLFQMLVDSSESRKSQNRLYPQDILEQFMTHFARPKDGFDDTGFRLDQEQYQLLYLQLQYERYRREIYAERNRRLMGRSRDKRSLETERDRLREQVKKVAAENEDLAQQLDNTVKMVNEREQRYAEELKSLKGKYQNELEQNKCLRQANENLQTRLNEETVSRKETKYELEAMRGQIFNLNTELQHSQVQADLGLQCKQELARLEAEFIVMGEVQIRCRDRLAEIENFRARDEELHMLQDSYNSELKDVRHMLEEKSSQLDGTKQKIADLQSQLGNNEKVITEQKRLLRTVKDEYEEKFKSVSKKYEVQKTIIVQMEEKIMMSLHKPQAGAAQNACSPDTDRTDIASSMERNSPLSTSLASSESLSASLRSTDLRNLQQLVETPIGETSSSIAMVGAGASIIEGTRMPALDMASSANTATAAMSVGMAAAAINIMPTTSTSASSIAVHNFDMAAAAAAAAVSATSHTHPHLHLQQQQQHQQQQQQQNQRR